MARGIHTYGLSTQSLENNQTVLVYSSDEFEPFKKLTETGNFFDEVYKSELRKKYLSLIPFFIESRFAPKNFVLRMDLLPDAKYLKFQSLTWTGVHTSYEPLRYVVPITPYDYWC